VKRYFKKRCFV